MQRKPIHRINANKSKTRKQTFAEGSLERKAKYQAKEQAKFDAETERIIKKFSGNKNEAS